MGLGSTVIFHIQGVSEWGRFNGKFGLGSVLCPGFSLTWVLFFQRAIAILEIEKAWLWRQGGKRRSGCFMSVGLNKKDERWCFR